MGVRRLLVKDREIVSADGSRARSAFVYCPAEKASVDVARCKACAMAQEVTAGEVLCTPVTERSAPEETPAGSAAGAQILCVHADVPCQMLVSVAPREPWSVPVVDDQARFLGFVASRQLAPPPRIRRPTVLDSIPARDLTSGTVLAIHECTTVRAALRLMAHRSTRVLALVDDEGVLRGALSDIEALGALRRR